MSGQLHLVGSVPERGSSTRPRFPVTVVLADDHPAVRRNLKALLDRETDMMVVAEAAKLSSAARAVRQHCPHVLVLDAEMRVGSSGDTIARLCSAVPDTGIVALTMEPSAVFARQALDAGAVALVLKDRADDELPTAVRMAAAGEEYVSSRVLAGLNALRGNGAPHCLTSREIEILRLIALGHTSAEIADKLHLSRRTVEAHRAHIHHKLHTRTRAELVRYALERHLIGA